MTSGFAEIAFTPRVKALQERAGSRAAYARAEAAGKERDAGLSAREAQFLAARDSFYMASVGETGWPYIQHRGGPTGFLRVIDPHTIGFADFAGNRQYVSVGNLAGDDRVALFFMSYAERLRLKMFGRVRMVDPSDTTTLEKLAAPGYRARIERGVLISVSAFDWNCPQHITPRFTAAEIEPVVGGLRARVAELEAELARRKS